MLSAAAVCGAAFNGAVNTASLPTLPASVQQLWFGVVAAATFAAAGVFSASRGGKSGAAVKGSAADSQERDDSIQYCTEANVAWGKEVNNERRWIAMQSDLLWICRAGAVPKGAIVAQDLPQLTEGVVQLGGAEVSFAGSASTKNYTITILPKAQPSVKLSIQFVDAEAISQWTAGLKHAAQLKPLDEALDDLARLWGMRGNANQERGLPAQSQRSLPPPLQTQPSMQTQLLQQSLADQKQQHYLAPQQQYAQLPQQASSPTFPTMSEPIQPMAMQQSLSPLSMQQSLSPRHLFGQESPSRTPRGTALSTSSLNTGVDRNLLSQQLGAAEAQAKALTELFKQREDYREDREKRIEARLRSYEAQQHELAEKKNKALNDISRAWALSSPPRSLSQSGGRSERGGLPISPPRKDARVHPPSQSGSPTGILPSMHTTMEPTGFPTSSVPPYLMQPPMEPVASGWMSAPMPTASGCRSPAGRSPAGGRTSTSPGGGRSPFGPP